MAVVVAVVCCLLQVRQKQTTALKPKTKTIQRENSTKTWDDGVIHTHTHTCSLLHPYTLATLNADANFARAFLKRTSSATLRVRLRLRLQRERVKAMAWAVCEGAGLGRGSVTKTVTWQCIPWLGRPQLQHRSRATGCWVCCSPGNDAVFAFNCIFVLRLPA